MAFIKADESLVRSDKTWDDFFKTALLRPKQAQLLSLLSMNKSYCPFIAFKQRLYSEFFYLFLSAVLMSLNFPFICVLSVFFLLGVFFASIISIIF
jgi:hypothetical protein